MFKFKSKKPVFHKTLNNEILKFYSVSEGGKVMLTDENGESEISGKYKFSTGEDIEVKNSKITKINLNLEKMKKDKNTFKFDVKGKTRRFAKLKNESAGVDGVAEATDENLILIVDSENIEEGAEVVIIDEEMNVVEDFSGTLEIEEIVDGEVVEEVVDIVDGVITKLEEVGAEDSETSEDETVEASKVKKTKSLQTKSAKKDVESAEYKLIKKLVEKIDKLEVKYSQLVTPSTSVTRVKAKVESEDSKLEKEKVEYTSAIHSAFGVEKRK